MEAIPKKKFVIVTPQKKEKEAKLLPKQTKKLKYT